MTLYEVHLKLKNQEPNRKVYTFRNYMYGYLAIIIVEPQEGGFLMRWNFYTDFDSGVNKPVFVEADSLTAAFKRFIEEETDNTLLEIGFAEVGLHPSNKETRVHTTPV